MDYQLKAQLLKTDLPLYQRKISKLFFEMDAISNKRNGAHFWLSKEDLQAIETKRELVAYYNEKAKNVLGVDFCSDECIEAYGFDAFHECLKINNASYHRVKRLKDKIASMIEFPCVFLTITFKPKYYGSSDTTKRKYVQRFLNGLNCPYVANVDYGKKNGRLHYHALVQIDRVSSDLWSYGNLDFKAVYNKNNVALAKYISKLTNHAIKETAKGKRLLYDKK